MIIGKDTKDGRKYVVESLIYSPRRRTAHIESATVLKLWGRAEWKFPPISVHLSPAIREPEIQG